MRARRAAERGRAPRVPGRGRPRLRPLRGRALAARHPRRAPARLLARVGDRARGPLAAARADHGRLLGPQRVRRPRRRAGRLRRVGRRLEPRGHRSVSGARRARAAGAALRRRGALAVASGLRSGRRCRRRRAPGQRRGRGALERRLRVPRPCAWAREPDHPGRDARRSGAVRRRPRGGRGDERRRRARRPRGAHGGGVRLAGDPAAQRGSRAARAADRRRPDRPRRRRLRLRGHRPPAERSGGVRARAAPLHGAGHHRGAQRLVRRGRLRPLPLPGARPAGPGGLSGQRRGLRDEAVVAGDASA